MATQGNAWAQSSDTHDPNVLRGLAAAVFGLPVASHANALSDTARAGGFGVVLGGDLLVAGTGGLNYSVAAGRVVAAGTSSSAQGAYVGYNTAGYTDSLDAHSAFIRHDLICYRVRDTDVDGSGAEQDDFAVVKGTTGSTDPAIPASLGSLVVLARAVVPATSGTPTFTDLRPRATAAGGVHICTSSTRPTGVARYPMRVIAELDTSRFMWWNGSAWSGMRSTSHSADGLLVAGTFAGLATTASLTIPDQGCAGFVHVTYTNYIFGFTGGSVYESGIYDSGGALNYGSARGFSDTVVVATARMAMSAGASLTVLGRSILYGGSGTATTTADGNYHRLVALFVPT